jgi:hypothetical protein
VERWIRGKLVHLVVPPKGVKLIQLIHLRWKAGQLGKVESLPPT